MWFAEGLLDYVEPSKVRSVSVSVRRLASTRGEARTGCRRALGCDVINLTRRRGFAFAQTQPDQMDHRDAFTQPFQEAMTAWCWCFGWGDDTIDAKTRSMMNLSMIGALGKMTEWELHCRGALNNGVTKEEIRAIIHVIAIYCGVPQGLECFRAARKVLAEDSPN